jgi:hypothetical protein
MSEVQLGKTTGSLVNALYALESVKVPNIGDGATILSWTDRHPATVIDIEEKGRYVYVTTQDDNYHRVDKNGMSDAQTYLYSPNPEGAIRHWRINQRGETDRVSINPETGRWNKWGSGGIYFGRREKFHDFSF